MNMSSAMKKMSRAIGDIGSTGNNGDCGIG
jgi:hypothetical protein